MTYVTYICDGSRCVRAGSLIPRAACHAYLCVTDVVRRVVGVLFDSGSSSDRHVADDASMDRLTIG